MFKIRIAHWWAVLVVLNTACGSSVPTLPSQVGSLEAPDWYTAGDHPGFPRQQYLVGVGACSHPFAPAERAECASGRAVEQLVLSVRAEVTVLRQNRCTSKQSGSSGGESASRLDCTSVSEGASSATLGVVDTRPRAVACRRDSCFALVAVPRSQVVEQLRQKRETLRARRGHLQATAKNADPIGAIQSLREAMAVVAREDELSEVIFAVTGVSEPMFGPLVQKAITDLLGESRVCLSGAVAEIETSQLLSALSRSLTEFGFPKLSISTPADGCTIWVRVSGKLERSSVVADTPTGGPRKLNQIWADCTVSLGLGDKPARLTTAVRARGLAESEARARAEAIADLVGEIERETMRLLRGEG